MQGQSTAHAVEVEYEVLQDKLNPSDWRVEHIDTKSGDCFVTIFSGPLARERALEYARFKNR
jgi:hypothetical protein